MLRRSGLVHREDQGEGGDRKRCQRRQRANNGLGSGQVDPRASDQAGGVIASAWGGATGFAADPSHRMALSAPRRPEMRSATWAAGPAHSHETACQGTGDIRSIDGSCGHDVDHGRPETDPPISS